MKTPPVFLSGESHGQRSLQAAVHSVAESDTTEVTWHACNQCSEWLVSKVLSHLEATYFIVPKNSINLS